MDIELNESWISGKYKNGEVNTAYSWVTVYSPDVFIQGEDADIAIKAIYEHWLLEDTTAEQSFDWYVQTYLNE